MTIKRRIKELPDDKVFCIVCKKRLDVKAVLTGKRRILGNEYADGFKCFKCDRGPKAEGKDE